MLIVEQYFACMLADSDLDIHNITGKRRILSFSFQDNIWHSFQSSRKRFCVDLMFRRDY